MQKEEFIQDYIANRLSDEDKTRFEELLKTDLEFRELYETHKEMAAAFQLSKSKEIKARLQALDHEETPVKTKSFFQSKFRSIAVAAVLVLGMFFMVNLLNSNGDLYETYFEICPNTYLPVTRGSTQNDIQFEAFKAYESGDFKTAETTFKKILETEKNTTIEFYYAMSLLNQDKFDLALAQLNAVQDIRFDYQVEVLWYAALIQLKNKDVKRAKQHLKTIQQLNKDFKTEEIQSILNLSN